MKYKEGDEVRIKTWEEMEKEFTPTTSGNISIHKYSNYSSQMENIVRELDTDRVVTILKVNDGDDMQFPRIPHYKIEESDTKWVWTDEMIERLSVLAIPIENRFEILDL